jgi:hypothetical protein
LTVSSLRARAGFVSHRRRSWDSPFGAFPSRKVFRAFPPGRAHLPFLLSVHQPHEAAGRPDRPRLLGFTPFESASRPDIAVTCLTAGCSLGLFSLPGHSGKSLDRGPTRPPLTCFADPLPERRISRRLRVSVGSRLASTASEGKPPRTPKTTLLGFPHRSGPGHSGESPPGL